MVVKHTRRAHVRVSKKTGRSQWVSLATVASENEPGIDYTISQRGDQVGCSCLAYRFKKGEKTCKHINAYRASLVSFDRQVHVRETPRARVSVGGETFSILRAPVPAGVRGIRFED